MKEKKWSDLAQYEYPEAAGLVASKDIIRMLQDRLITKVNLLAWNAQFIADLDIEVSAIESSISLLNTKKKYLINYHLTKSFDKIPNYYKRSKDLMASWIEENLVKNDIMTFNDKIEKSEANLLDVKKELLTYKYKYEVLQKSIDVGICLVNSMRDNEG